MAKTQHVFRRTGDDGIQTVILRKPPDAKQRRLIKQHLSQLASSFKWGDFSDPVSIYGEDMPGLQSMRSAQADEIQYAYKTLRHGAQITYSSQGEKLVSAIHAWFDAQLVDHGYDAESGHSQHGHANCPMH